MSVRIAFIGLGAMGGPMARNLAKTPGIDLAVFDLKTELLAPFERSARVASSMEDVLAGADAVFTVLPADPHVRNVADAVAAAGAGNRWFVDFSTVSAVTIDEAASRLADAGIETISVTLTRGPAASAAGELGLFVGVDALPTELEPAFRAMATDVFLVGSRGAAKVFKIANNMVVSALNIVICEAIVLGEVCGLEPAQVTTALTDAGVDSWVLRNHIIAYLLPDDLGPGRFSTRYMAKDITLCNSVAKEAGVPAYFAGLALSYYRGSIACGYGEDHHTKVIRWLETMAAVPRRAEVDAEEALRVIVEGVAAVQAVVSSDALRLSAVAGMPPHEAAMHLENGSAGNSGLRWWQSEEPRPVAPSINALLTQVIAAVDLAQRIDVPASSFEMARHGLIAASAAHGVDAPMWSED